MVTRAGRPPLPSGLGFERVQELEEGGLAAGAEALEAHADSAQAAAGVAESVEHLGFDLDGAAGRGQYELAVVQRLGREVLVAAQVQAAAA